MKCQQPGAGMLPAYTVRTANAGNMQVRRRRRYEISGPRACRSRKVGLFVKRAPSELDFDVGHAFQSQDESALLFDELMRSGALGLFPVDLKQRPTAQTAHE